MTVVGLAATPAAADQGVQVSVAYGQASYKSDDTFSVTLTITNNTPQDLQNVQAFAGFGGSCLAGQFNWPKLGNTFTVLANSTVTDTETGANPIPGGLGGTATCFGTITSLELPTPIQYSTSVPVTQAFGGYSGVLFRDRNHDGTFEPGEGVAGITVTAGLSGSPNDLTFTTTSGTDGRFAFAQLPVGNYFVLFSSKRNWVIDSPDFVDGNGADVAITETGPPPVSLPVLPPLSDKLKVTFAFDQAGYQPTDTAHLTITLANTSRSAITGVVADCNRVGDPNALDSTDGWGALGITGPGATIPAGSTQTFHIDQPIPGATQQSGYLHAPCVFGPEPDGLPQVGFPGGDPVAQVPGLTSAVLLETASGTGTTPVAGVHVELVNFATHVIVASGVTDANGQLSLPTLPANQYIVRITGKWKLAMPGSGFLRAVSPGDPTNARIYGVVPRT